MRVARDRIGAVDAGQVTLEARRDDGGAAPRRIDVKPEILRPAEAPQLRQGVDRTGARGAGGPDHHERRASVSTIRGDASGQIAEIHPQMAVRRDRPDRPAPESGHVGDLAEGVVGLAGQVEGRRSGESAQSLLPVRGERPRQRDDDGREIRLRAAAREACDGRGREAELAHQPGEGVPLDLVRRRRRPPGRQLRVVHRDQRIRDDRGHRHARIEEAEVTRVGDVHLPRPQHRLDVGDDLIEVDRVREIVARREVAANLVRRHRRDDGPIRDVGLELHGQAPDLVECHAHAAALAPLRADRYTSQLR